MRVIQGIACNEQTTNTTKFFWNYLGLYNDPNYLRVNILSTDIIHIIKEALSAEG